MITDAIFHIFIIIKKKYVYISFNANQFVEEL